MYNMRISYNKNDKNELQLFNDRNNGEFECEISEEVFGEIFNEENPKPFKLVDDEIVVDETQLRINIISQELESTKHIIDEVNEYHANQEEVPPDLLDILDERKILKEELAELEI